MNDDVRQNYAKLTPDQERGVAEIKQAGQEFIDKLRAAGHSREASIAITNAEQAVMWGVKAVTAYAAGGD